MERGVVVVVGFYAELKRCCCCCCRSLLVTRLQMFVEKFFIVSFIGGKIRRRQFYHIFIMDPSIIRILSNPYYGAMPSNEIF